MSKATKTAYDDLQRLTQDVRQALLNMTANNALPDREALLGFAERARALARRQKQTLLGITVSEQALAQTREDFKKIADSLSTLPDFKAYDAVYPVLTEAARALNRALAEVPKTKPLVEQLKEKISGLLRGAQNPVMRPPAPAKPKINIESVVAKAQRVYKEKSAALAKRLVAGELTVEQWRQDMMRAIRDLHFTAAVAGAGGIGYLTPEAISAIDAKVREQGTYLNNWANQLTSQQQLSEGQIVTRAHLYSGASSALANETADTVTYGRFPKLPCYPVDGHTLCRGNCKCKDWRWDILDAEKGDADVYWQLSPAEHCDTCLYRAQVFNPLKIREFKIVTEYDPIKVMHR